MKKVWIFLSYVLVAALTSFATLFMVAWNLPDVPADVTPSQEAGKLEEMVDLIDTLFIGDVDRTALEDAAAHAIVAATGDRWSYYVPADEYQSYLDDVNNSYVGIGVTIQVQQEGAGFTVIKLTPGAPAEEAGIQMGDEIVGVNGTDVRGMATGDVQGMVKGKEGTFVDITVLRAGEELTLSVERRTVVVPVATGQLLEGNVGLVTIANFHSGCANQSIAAIEALRGQGATALILDVRNNGGGYAHEMVALLDYLLPKGLLFRTVDYAGNEQTNYSDAKFLDMPMAVLVNGNSYSAAEFFAVALREYEAAVVVGEQTVGKGYFQVNYPLSDGSAVNLSIGEYFTPKGENLAGIGITPDIEIPVDEQTAALIYAGSLNPQKDPQIQAALENLKNP